MSLPSTLAATALFATLISPSLRTGLALAGLDARAWLWPVSMSLEPDEPTAEVVRRLRAECVRLRRVACATNSAGISEPNESAATVLWSNPGGRAAFLSVPPRSEAVEAPDSNVALDRSAEVDALVLFGSSVAGRVLTAGRASAAVRSVRDPEFSIAAGIMRDTPHGLVEGPTGVYRGGERGHLTQVPAERAVRVGDLVYTLEESSWSPRRLAVGEVVEAHLADGDPDWTIAVRPLCDLRRHDRVRILQPRPAGGRL